MQWHPSRARLIKRYHIPGLRSSLADPGLLQLDPFGAHPTNSGKLPRGYLPKGYLPKGYLHFVPVPLRSGSTSFRFHFVPVLIILSSTAGINLSPKNDEIPKHPTSFV